MKIVNVTNITPTPNPDSARVQPGNFPGYTANYTLVDWIELARKTKPAGYPGVWSIPIPVGPTIAHELTNRGNPNERNATEACIAKYTYEMNEDLWTLSTDPIVLDTQGRRCNANQRTQAVIRAGHTIIMQLAVDVSDAVIKNMDRGKGRSLSQRMTLAGNLSKTTAERIKNVGVAMSAGGFCRRPYPEANLWAFIERYKDVIATADAHMRGHKKGVGRAVVIAAFARVLVNHPNKDSKLAHAAIILGDGSADIHVPGEKSLTRLRDKLLDPSIYKTGASSNYKIYRDASEAIHAYLTGANLRKLHPTLENYYPLPEDAGVDTFDGDDD